jgi:hypothetical protein
MDGGMEGDGGTGVGIERIMVKIADLGNGAFWLSFLFSLFLLPLFLFLFLLRLLLLFTDQKLSWIKSRTNGAL